MLEKISKNWRAFLIAGIFVCAGILLLLSSLAALPRIAIDFNEGSHAVFDSGASGNIAFVFGQNSGGGPPANYAASLARITASTFRNKTMDDSPFTNTPSVQLIGQQSLYASDPSLYDRYSGSYGTVPFFANTRYPGSASSPNGATFRANCEVSHFSYDDPIVYPNQPEKAHLHMFFGNTHVNAFSTYDTILNSGSSTCNGKELNRTAYWVPAMMDGAGNAIVPFNNKFYYKTEMNAYSGGVSVYPENLQIVGDNTNNNAGDSGLAAFRCNNIYNGGKGAFGNTIPTCYDTAAGYPGVLEYIIFFDYCWNGDTSTVGDWQANRDRNLVPPLYYWHSGNCPSSHPKRLPALVTHIFYDIPPGTNTANWHLSSDVDPATGNLKGARGATAHADWFGGWNKEINKEWVDNCSDVPGAECGEGYLRNAYSNPNAKALVMREDWDAGQIHSIPLQQIYEQMCSAASTRPYNPANGGRNAAYCRP